METSQGQKDNKSQTPECIWKSFGVCCEWQILRKERCLEKGPKARRLHCYVDQKKKSLFFCTFPPEFDSVRK